MKKNAVLLCFVVVSINIFSTIIHELVDYHGNNFFILLHSLSFLLLLLIAYTTFVENRKAARNTQSKIKESFDAMKSLFMHMPGAVMTLKKDFTIIEVNELVKSATGFNLSEIQGKKCYDVLGNGDICCDCLVQTALASGKPQYGTRIKYEKDSKTIYGKQTVIPIRDECGNIEYLYEIVTDITQEVFLEKENSEILMDIVTSLAHLIETRDPSTGTHCINVQRIALLIGEIMGLNNAVLKELSIAAILHDIGKIGIPESILNKPERLNAVEFLIIQRHPQIGYNAIKHIKRLQVVSEAILDHHEHYNGEGYPNGKKKDEISMIARILTVADVYEALTSDRVYRKAMSTKQAVEIIGKGKGRQFDPRVVDALFELVYTKKIKQIC
ncbi:HD domain-containing phosphohydrolase [Dendrosporobacter sp. 1207_IL3150]|uniref:HD domain-containing phosphohydrolase n=1 Tax=Dendrosporobacter sp. 1207_IL3150 TaxID=3084054 RepID=UPI002FDAA47E